jgi:UPF0755 protein
MKIRKLFSFLFIFFLLLAFAVGASYFYSLSPIKSSTESQNENTLRFKVVPGTNAKNLGLYLQEQKIIRSGFVFYAQARLDKVLLKTGIYSVKDTMSVKEILDLLSSGKQELISVSIPEGYTISQIGELLQEKEVANLEEFISAAHNPELLNQYNIVGDSFEGYLFPDTYYFDPEMNSEIVVKQMVENFFTKITTIPGLTEKSPEELQDIVNLASIVEKEYRLSEEAPLIASVFTNRLRRSIGLYSCATLVYIITEIEKRPHPDVITIADTKIDSLYNTYKWHGLPPGPISNPGLIALGAAANPPKTNYYYFRLIDPEQGKHVFTSNFDDHIEAGETIQTKKKSN